MRISAIHSPDCSHEDRLGQLTKIYKLFPEVDLEILHGEKSSYKKEGPQNRNIAKFSDFHITFNPNTTAKEVAKVLGKIRLFLDEIENITLSVNENILRRAEAILDGENYEENSESRLQDFIDGIETDYYDEGKIGRIIEELQIKTTQDLVDAFLNTEKFLIILSLEGIGGTYINDLLTKVILHIDVDSLIANEGFSEDVPTEPKSSERQKLRLCSNARVKLYKAVLRSNI